MKDELIVQGRRLTRDEVRFIERLIAAHPSWHRTRLSRELCAHWSWRAVNGQLKDMACRTLLLKLERRGLIALPARQAASVNHFRHHTIAFVPHSVAPIYNELRALRPLRVQPVCCADDQALFGCLLDRYHYLGYGGAVGENLKYLVRDRAERPVACLLFGSAAWKVRPRDEFIGWQPTTRERNLGWLTNNMRFLIPPWVRVPHLASHILARVARCIAADWTDKYDHRVVLLETYVERPRFHGTCFQGANWRYVGDTQGRTRNDTTGTASVARKAIYLYPLIPQVGRWLCHTRT